MRRCEPVPLHQRPTFAEAQRVVLLSAKLLSVQGTWQSEKGVQSLVAMNLVDHTHLLSELRVKSRDFR
jgi:error-prone DNA polymerase